MDKSSHSSISLGVTEILTEVTEVKFSWQSRLRGFSSKLRFSKVSQVLISSTSTSAMKFFLALILMIFGKLRRQSGNRMKELCEISTVSICSQVEISSGSVDILLYDKFKSVIKLNLVGNLGGIFVMTFEERLQDVN